MSATDPGPGQPGERVAKSASGPMRCAPARGLRFARLAAYGLGALLVASIFLLAAAGVPAAVAVIVTVAAVIAMIALGSILGGRDTPQREPVPLHGSDGRRVDLPAAGAPGPDDTVQQ